MELGPHMTPKRLNRPIILGIVGDSASGKTTLSAGVARILGSERCTVIGTDDYHKFDRVERTERGLTALDPRANHVDILEQHLRLLRNGNPVLKPVYNHASGTLERSDYIPANDFLIVEGLLGYTTRAMRDCYDVKIYLDTEEDLRIQWKVYRDTVKRGYNRDEVLQSLAKRKDDSPAFIHPQRTFADIVIRFQRPDARATDAAHLNVRHVLRPTLPHPDFSPLFDESRHGGLHLELARDADGKPVDVLEISGGISDQTAEDIEELMWGLIPEASHLRAQLGHIDIGEGTDISHPLALTQLLVAYHMVKAGMGVHAV